MRETSTTENDEQPATDISVRNDELVALESLGYVDHAPAENPTERGVTTDHADVTGLNLFGSRDRAEALLMNAEGEVLHRWESERRESWMHVEPTGDGSILAITKDVAVAKYDWDSEEIWRTRLAAHHDVAIREDEHILTLTRGPTSIEHEGVTLTVLCDTVVVLSPDGEVVERHPLLPLFQNAIDDRRLDSVARRLEEGGGASDFPRPGSVADVLHTNSITILRDDIEGVAPEGSVLLSSRTLSRIAIVSAEFDEVLWTWGRGELDGQHDATQLDNGHLLVFDNGLKRAQRSRVIEVDAAAGAVVWTYEDPELYTRLRGGAQGLSNGNVLITESDEGHVFEVTRDGEMVWEFWNPDVRGSGEQAERATIYRLNRYPRSFFPALDAG